MAKLIADPPSCSSDLCNMHAASFGNRAVAGGWLARAERLVIDLDRRVAVAEGQLEQAIVALGRALDLSSRLDLPFETAEVRLELARAHVAACSELAEAVAEARRALTAFDRLGATADADAAAALLRSLGAAGRPRSRSVGVLTKREDEVLRLVGLGLSNPEIAQRLYISRKTAAHHVSNVFTKLGLRNRSEAQTSGNGVMTTVEVTRSRPGRRWVWDRPVGALGWR